MNNLYETDKQFIERLKYFVDEVENEENQQLDDETRYLAVLSVLIGSQGLDVFKYVLKEALNKNALSPIMVKETVYQATAYMGIGRAFLIRVVSQCVPYIGYPRSLNALSCIEKASEGK